jgi:hypothetical protein
MTVAAWRHALVRAAILSSVFCLLSPVFCYSLNIVK